MQTGEHIELLPVLSDKGRAGSLPSELAGLLEQHRQIPLLLALDEERIIGWAACPDRDNCLHSLYVEPAYRRRGIGTRLYHSLVSLLLDYGCPRLRLHDRLHYLLGKDSATRAFLRHAHGQAGAKPKELDLRDWMSPLQRQILNQQNKLGIPYSYGIRHALPLQADADSLTEIGPDCWQRPQKMLPEAAAAWTLLRHSASNDGIDLVPVSAFRSIGYQAGLIRRKLEQGSSMEDILKVSAAPGYSEHHSGRAIDITDGQTIHLEEEFARSQAFEWLQRNADRFDFHLSYPENNPHGIAFEPWHWCWRGA